MSLDIPDRKDASEAKDGDIPSTAHEPSSARGRRAMQGRREVNQLELEQYGFGIFYRDEQGHLQQLKDQ